MIKTALIAASVLAFAAVGANAAKPASVKTQAKAVYAVKDNGSRGFLLKSIKVDGGKNINYSIYIPQNYTPKTKMPLIIFLHGSGECGTNGIQQLVTGLPTAIMRNSAKWNKFIVLIPQKQKVDDDWAKDEAQHIMAMYKETLKTYSIDTDRIYLTGLSQGGRGTYTIAAMYPKMFAAIAPMCGWANEDVADKIKNIPIWIFHGELDDDFEAFVQNSYNMDKWLKDRGAKDEKLTIVPGVAHACWDIGYQQHPLADWFLAHKLDK